MPFFPFLLREIKANNASLFEFLLDVNIHFPSLACLAASKDPMMFCLDSYVLIH